MVNVLTISDGLSPHLQEILSWRYVRVDLMSSVHMKAWNSLNMFTRRVKKPTHIVVYPADLWARSWSTSLASAAPPHLRKNHLQHIPTTTGCQHLPTECRCMFSVHSTHARCRVREADGAYAKNRKKPNVSCLGLSKRVLTSGSLMENKFV